MSYVVEDRRRIAPHPAMPRTGEGRAVVAALKLGLVYRDKLTDVGSRDLQPRRQPCVECLAGKAHVPRTDILTDVAPEQPVVHLRALGCVERSPMLDREIRDARARVEITRPGEGLGGAGVKTAPAGAAAVRLERQVRLETSVGEHDADERERADLGMDQHHVLADPAEPGELSQLPLGHGTGVHIAARCRPWNERADRRGELLEALARDVMVPACPSASQRSNSAAWGLRSSRAIPTVEKPSLAP